MQEIIRILINTPQILTGETSSKQIGTKSYRWDTIVQFWTIIGCIIVIIFYSEQILKLSLE